MAVENKTEQLLKLLLKRKWKVGLEALDRLVDGDLSHIGDGLLKGRAVLWLDEPVTNPSFEHLGFEYSLSAPMRTVFGVEVEEFVEEDFDRKGYATLYEVYPYFTYHFRKVSVCKPDVVCYSNSFFKHEQEAKAVTERLNSLLNMTAEQGSEVASILNPKPNPEQEG